MVSSTAVGPAELSLPDDSLRQPGFERQTDIINSLSSSDRVAVIGSQVKNEGAWASLARELIKINVPQHVCACLLFESDA